MRGVPLIRAPLTLPRVIDPDEANAFLAALRTHRDRAMVEAMLLGASSTGSPNGAIPNPPQRPRIFAGDIPIIDKPLPRFLDDAAATKLMRTARADPDPLSGLIVDLLARTGIRKSELLALTVDAVVQIGSAFWLRIPIGKLHNDPTFRCTGS